LENTIRHLTAIGQTVDITGPEAQLVLGQQPAIDATIGQGDEGKLSAAVAQHLKRYFDLHGGALPAPGLYGRILREIEAPLIEIALDATGGNQAKCADLLGLNRNTLRKKITDLDIQVTRRRKLM
jgi:two-component system nitrogen regulation response regulator GlnG